MASIRDAVLAALLSINGPAPALVLDTTTLVKLPSDDNAFELVQIPTGVEEALGYALAQIQRR